MDDNTLAAITWIVVWGWLPILAVWKSIQWVICAIKVSNEPEDVGAEDVCDNCESASCNGCKY
jgi:hypothetical protein